MRGKITRKGPQNEAIFQPHLVQTPCSSRLRLRKARTQWYIRPTASNELYRQRTEGLRLKNVPLAELWHCKGVELASEGCN